MMDSAIYKKTGIEYYAWQIWKLGAFEEKNLHKKGLWLCPQEEIENIDEIKEEIYVTPVKAHIRKDVRIPPFFRLYPKYSDKVRLVKESEDHKKAKIVICALLTEEFNFQFRYDRDIYSIKDLPINYEKIQKNIRKREVTKHNILTDKKKRADVLIPFIFSPFWGNGLAIEIKISEKDENIEEKEDFWFQRGYSMIWLDESNFELIDGRLGIKGNTLDILPFSIGYNRILDRREEEMRTYLHAMYELKDMIIKTKSNIGEFFTEKTQELNEKYSEKEIEINQHALDEILSQKREIEELIINLKEKVKKTCRTCKHGTKNMKDWNGETVACWFDTRWGKGKARGDAGYPSIHEPLDGCDYFENR